VSADASPDQVFLFGKLPAHGDFVCRGLSPDERAAWDLWCSAELSAAREQLGARFNEAHLTTLPWRFVLAPAKQGSAWMAGCMTPSCDKVGRPFLLALGVKSAVPLDPAAQGARLARLMWTPIHQAFRLDADRLVAVAVAALAAPAPTRPPSPPVEMTDWRVGRIGLPQIVDAFGDVE
jgi:type VI secretion system ImpM family protein